MFRLRVARKRPTRGDYWSPSQRPNQGRKWDSKDDIIGASPVRILPSITRPADGYSKSRVPLQTPLAIEQERTLLYVIRLFPKPSPSIVPQMNLSFYLLTKQRERCSPCTWFISYLASFPKNRNGRLTFSWTQHLYSPTCSLGVRRGCFLDTVVKEQTRSSFLENNLLSRY